MYTIAHASKKVGISPATLRSWEGRHGVVVPRRAANGYRTYDDRDVTMLRAIKNLVDLGWPIGMAAAEVARRISGAEVEGPRTVGPAPLGPSGHVPALAERLIEAARSFNAADLSAALDETFARQSFETVMTEHVFPALDDLGRAWADERINVAGEHLVSNALMRRLSMVYEAAAAYGQGPRVALGTAPGVRHEIGILSFAVAARRRGVATDYLGSDIPVVDWCQTATQHDLAAVVLAIPTTADVSNTRDVINAFQDLRPDLIVAVGGSEQQQAPAAAIRLGHDITAGATAIASLVVR